MADEQKKSDGEFIVVVNGQRASKTMSEGAATQEAQKRRESVQENQGSTAPDVQVKQNLCG
ncbi:MAG: hypothetical protein ACYSUV_01950 [Planctomycetota bacterium]|jgi:hypothetical protein